jgi:hypothetical protein
MAADSVGGILPDRNTDSDGGDILRQSHQVLHEVYACSWLDVMDHCNRGTHLADAAWQDPHQCSEEVKKDWLFEVILLTLILPFY